MSKSSLMVLAALVFGGQALAADNPPAATTTTTTTTTAPNADLEAQLAAARQKLEAAARDVAQLSSQLGHDAMVRAQGAMVRAQGLRTRAVLGLQLQTEPSAKDQGATIIGVSPGGPAAEAGLTTGDIIVAINGDATTGPNATREVVDHMAGVKPDTKVTLKIMREGKAKEFQVTPRASFAAFMPQFNGPQFEFNWVGPDGPGGPNFEGMELTELSPALGQYFGTSQGVLVVRVPRDGDFLKLQDGDVIQSIDGRVPENGSHATRILRSYQPGETIHLKVMRQKKSLELEGMLPERRHVMRAMRGPGDHPPPEQD